LTDLRRPLDPVYLQPRVIASWAVTVVWAGTISLLSTTSYSGAVTGWLLTQLLFSLRIHLSVPTFDALHFLIRKLAHGSEYAIFGLLLYHSFDPRHPEGWNIRSAFGALITAGLYSLLDEYHQSFVPGRTASLVDSGIDTAAVLLGLALLYGGRRLQASNSSKAAADESTAEMKKGTGGE
jgi:VanZ family protein